MQKDKDDKRPFTAKQCEKCAWWQPLDEGAVYSRLGYACHYTYKTGNFRKINPPKCDSFIGKKG